MRKIFISASSMPAGRNMSSQLEYIKRVQNNGADMYHLDVMDGEFVKNKTLDYNYFEQLKENSTLMFDVHLMVKEPQKVIKKYIKAGSEILSVHYEAFDDKRKILKVIKKIKKLGALAGIAVDIETDISEIMYLINVVDVVLIMAVKAGNYGKTFDNRCVDKIKAVRERNQKVLIEVDGGMTDKTVKLALSAGADIIVSGAYIYNSDAYIAIQKLRGN